MRPLALSLFVVAAGCGSALVANSPRTVMLPQAYDPAAVRDAVARALHHRHLEPTGEAPGQVMARGAKTPCTFTVAYSGQGATIATASPTPNNDTRVVDSRCLEESTLLGKAIEHEVARPAKEAKREAREEQKREATAARNAAWAAQMQYAAEQQAAAAAQQPPPPADPDGDDLPPADTGVAPAPPPPPVEYNYAQTNVQSNVQSNVTSTTTVNNYTPAPQERAPQLKANLCCVRGKAYACPDALTYAAACVQHTADLARTCPRDNAQARYCPR